MVDEILTINEYNTMHEDTIPDEYHLHEVRLKLQGQNLPDYQLTANVRDVLKGAHQSKKYDRKSLYVLLFDSTGKIFYSRVEHLNAPFRMDSSTARPRVLTGDYPMVDLGPDEKYYYIDDTSYTLTQDDSGNKSILSKVH